MLAVGWSPAEWLAFAGIVATALVALAGLSVQVILSSIRAREDRRKARYEEMLEFYREIGEALDELVRSLYLASAGMGLTLPIDRPGVFGRLRLHGASAGVLNAFKDALDTGRELHRKTSAGQLATEEERMVIAGRVGIFYNECNRHLRAIWPRRDPLDEDVPPIAWANEVGGHYSN